MLYSDGKWINQVFIQMKNWMKNKLFVYFMKRKPWFFVNSNDDTIISETINLSNEKEQ